MIHKVYVCMSISLLPMNKRTMVKQLESPFRSSTQKPCWWGWAICLPLRIFWNTKLWGQLKTFEKSWNLLKHQIWSQLISGGVTFPSSQVGLKIFPIMFQVLGREWWWESSPQFNLPFLFEHLTFVCRDCLHPKSPQFQVFSSHL